MEDQTQAFELMEPASPEALVPTLGLWPWFVSAAIVITLLALLLLFRKRKPAATSLSIRQAAFAEASAAIAKLSPASPREAAVLSSLILRRYLSTAAGDPALFETHEEFISRHDSLQALTREARDAAESGFTRLASLKYAPEIPHADPVEVVAGSKALLETLHHGFAA